jgi:hypothetical protein
MSDQSIKSLILDLLRQDHADQQALVQSLTEEQFNDPGTFEVWSIKAHIAHRTFWCDDLARMLSAALNGQPVVPQTEDDHVLNAATYQQQDARSWADIYAEAQRVTATLQQLIEQFSEEEVSEPDPRFRPLTGEYPLYIALLGMCYEHNQEHLAQYYINHNQFERGVALREQCVNRILQTDLPDRVKGNFTYNLACFYALQNILDEADAHLHKAFTLAPHLQQYSTTDPDLTALRERSI